MKMNRRMGYLTIGVTLVLASVMPLIMSGVDAATQTPTTNAEFLNSMASPISARVFDMKGDMKTVLDVWDNVFSASIPDNATVIDDYKPYAEVTGAEVHAMMGVVRNAYDGLNTGATTTKLLALLQGLPHMGEGVQ